MRPSELKEWRKKLGLTQEEAGRRFGVSRVAEQNWESGTTPIPKSVEAATETIDLEWKRRPEFGPVWLIRFGNADGGRAERTTMPRELFLSNEAALTLVAATWGHKDVRNSVIQDEHGNSIWNFPRLKAEVEQRRNAHAAKADKAGMADRLMEIGRHCASLPVLDDRSDDEILGYDEFGLPHQ